MKINYGCQSQPLIAVSDVEKSSKWYQQLLGCESAHGGKEYDQLAIDGRTILQLHAWEIEHDHDQLIGKESIESRGNGAVLWFLVDEFDRCLGQIKELKSKVLKEVSVNPNANHREVWLNDPDGYVVVVASHYGDI